jgi:hypothetical protein
VRRECLDQLLIFSRLQLEHVLRVYIGHSTSSVLTEPSTCDLRIEAAEPILRPRKRFIRCRSGGATFSADSSTNTSRGVKIECVRLTPTETEMTQPRLAKRPRPGAAAPGRGRKLLTHRT